MTKPYKLGITGSIASGKSLVGTILSRQGIPVLDTDAVVHQLFEEDTDLQRALAEAFGPSILRPDGSVDRQILGQIVFSNPDAKGNLETWVHPRVGRVVEAFLENPEGHAIRAVLVPLLFEARTEDRYDEIWTICLDPDIQLNRLMERQTLTEEQAKERIAAQWPQDEKAKRSHRCIDNNGSPEETEQQVLAALEQIERQIGERV